MHTFTMPLSGHLLVAHLAAYGLATVLDAGDEQCLIGHDPLSLEMNPQVTTAASLERAAELVRASAAECESFVEADLNPGATGNDRRPVIWARTTARERASLAVAKREELLDGSNEPRIAQGLLTGLGAPAAWSERPQWGASRLDGVIGNHTSDFVRGVLRRSRLEAAETHAEELGPLWDGSRQSAASPEDDKTGWSPPGTKLNRVHQWLAGLGLSMLPVGQHANGRSSTPCFWRDGQGVTLPVFLAAVSVARLRCVLQSPGLCAPGADLAAPEAAHLRALEVYELVGFPLVDRSTAQSRVFSFARGSRVAL